MVLRPGGWEHRAFLGTDPIPADEFEARLAAFAASVGWGAAEAADRAGVYMPEADAQALAAAKSGA